MSRNVVHEDSPLGRAMSELNGTVCRCKRHKAARQTFCKVCYYALPIQIRRDLYKGVGEGYIEAYDAAVEHLTEGGYIR